MNYPTDRMQYIDMDNLYRPEVVYFDGMNGLGNVGGFWDSVFGKSQAWYDRLNAVQNKLAIASAEVAAFGDAVWNAVGKTAAVTAGAPPGFPSFADQMRAIEQAMTSSMVTEKHVPTDDAVDAADSTERTARANINYATKVAPELAADIAAAAEKAAKIVTQVSLSSPGEVGRAEFVKEIKERSKVLGAGLGIGGLAIAGVVLVALMVSRKFQNNPRRRRGRRRSTGPDIQKIALYGGLGYLAYTALAPKKSA
jgi:hypothetical protein